MEYTRDDIESYVEYCADLYKLVAKAFKPDAPINIENIAGKDIADVMDKYVDIMGRSLSDAAPILSIYADLLEPFNVWLYHDCPFTGHKAISHIVSQVSLSSSGNGRKHPKMTVDGRNPLMKNSKTDGLQEAIDKLTGKPKARKKK